MGMGRNKQTVDIRQETQNRESGRNVFKKFKIEAVSSDDPTIDWKQPGGACIGINGNNIGAIVQSDRDKT
eukprot:10366301-Ditylum_brightwellii.AAC.1